VKGLDDVDKALLRFAEVGDAENEEKRENYQREDEAGKI
jgi:hypothetical protein